MILLNSGDGGMSYVTMSDVDATLTLEVHMLLDDTRLDVVVTVTLNRDIVPRHLPSVDTFDKRLGLICRGEV